MRAVIITDPNMANNKSGAVLPADEMASRHAVEELEKLAEVAGLEVDVVHLSLLADIFDYVKSEAEENSDPNIPDCSEHDEKFYGGK